MSVDWASNRGADKHLNATKARIREAQEAAEKARTAREQQPHRSNPRD